ncbi:MAG: thiamine biosynthesis protein ThiS [Bacteroidetes bacterium RIFCSPLOWO2_12_FULL_35_15]|nr:MAG: thiamine biosynthesis protein ThiS [Bacteroidetes bacterium RIFCSPLOWO2_12_FULL_35_15]
MIYINDKEYALKQTQSLSQLFQSLNINVEKGVAVAINNKVLPRTDWEKSIIKKNDKIILIKATQGG